MSHRSRSPFIPPQALPPPPIYPPDPGAHVFPNNNRIAHGQYPPRPVQYPPSPHGSQFSVLPHANPVMIPPQPAPHAPIIQHGPHPAYPPGTIAVGNYLIIPRITVVYGSGDQSRRRQHKDSHRSHRHHRDRSDDGHHHHHHHSDDQQSHRLHKHHDQHNNNDRDYYEESRIRHEEPRHSGQRLNHHSPLGSERHVRRPNHFERHFQPLLRAEARHAARKLADHIQSRKGQWANLRYREISESEHREICPDFKHSKCTGRKRALCIGIDYKGQKDELGGCINDAHNVREALIKQFGFPSDSIVVMSDDAKRAENVPTRKNILNAMRWLVKDAKPHDSLFFHYSGHGSQIKDKNGDEADGYDEFIFPLDYDETGDITDDLMHETMVANLPNGCRLTALYDSCHSGTVLDLPYMYNDAGSRARGGSGGLKVRRRELRENESKADVIAWAGCKDSQTSADTSENGTAVGAMSYAFLTSLQENPRQTYQQLIRSVRKRLLEYDDQDAQLGSSHKIDPNMQFII